MKTCRICLNMNVKVSLIGDTEASKLLQEILCKHGLDVIHSHHYICVFCKHLLNKFYSFIQRIIKAQTTLKKIIKQKKRVQINDLENIDSSLFSLNLSYKKIDKFFVGKKINNTSAENYKITKEAVDDILESDSLQVPRNISVDGLSAVSGTSKSEDYKPQRFLVDKNLILPTRLRNKPQKHIVDEFEENEDEQYKPQKNRRKSDDDFNPENNSSREDSSDSSDDVQYDDNGRRMRRSPKRVFPINCEECDYIINSGIDHYHHYLLFHKDKDYPYQRKAEYLCKFCGKSKTTVEHLKNHELTHGKPTLKCEDCGKMFYNKIRLHRHQKSHKPPKYECDYCHKKIHTRPDLILHIRTHTGEKPFKCHICGEAFAHKGNVRIHIHNNHQQEPMRKGRKPKSLNKTFKPKKKVIKKKRV